MNWTIVGLGNPGGEYSQTRHNAGFLCLDEIKTYYFSTDWKKTLLTKTVYATVEIVGEQIKFIKPQTFMNLSGRAVKKYIKSDEALKKLIVIHDDIHLPIGTIKISFGRNDAGHNGVTSLYEALHSKDFIRIRIGIAPKEVSGQKIKLDHFVLSKFTEGEREILRGVSRTIANAIEEIINSGLEKAMNTYNG